MTPETASLSTVPFAISPRDIAIAQLQERIRGSVLTPDHADFASATAAWVANTIHTPELVVLAESTTDVVEAVRFARANGLPVGVQGTGHGAVTPINAGVMINTRLMLAYTIDPVAQTARVEAGVKWAHIIDDLYKFGLAGLNGSTTDVGIVGYTLGGGTGWFARKHGFAADRVIGFDLVTAEGELLHVTAESHPDLFRGVRGGGSNFGIVTALEFGLIEQKDFFGGGVMYDLADAPKVFNAYTKWVETLPESVTSSIAIFRLPPLPMIPEPLRGRAFISVRAVGPVSGTEFLVEPMRKLAAPIMDSYGYHPYTMIDLVSMDPVDPMPEISSSTLLRKIDAATIDSILDVLGDGKDVPLLLVEFRHIDGAARKADPASSVANRFDLPWMAFALGVPFAPEIVPGIEAAHLALAEALAPVDSGAKYLNFVMKTDNPVGESKQAYSAENYAWLQALKRQWDPTNVFRFGRNITPNA